MYDAITSDGGALSLDIPPKVGILNSAITPQVTVANYGTSTLNNYTVNMEAYPTVWYQSANRLTYSETFTNSIPAAGTNTVSLSNANVTWPEGESKVVVYTTVTWR
ncbi:MAG: hypothetical protein U5L96_05595 [Owenweeksia sp.]|nr:hypothetical protein [Owenweeksia sp.]